MALKFILSFIILMLCAIVVEWIALAFHKIWLMYWAAGVAVFFMACIAISGFFWIWL